MVGEYIKMDIDKFLKTAVAEDIGRGDLFSKIGEAVPTTGQVIAKSAGIFAGKVYISRLAKLYNLEIFWKIEDGEHFDIGDTLFQIVGNSHTLMSLERVILNIILHASSIASLTNQYVQKISKYGVKLLDTRKTRPLLREFEKYASQVGGAINHRMGLDDALMLKDTHLKTIENLDSFLEEARKKIPWTTKIEIECEDVEVAKTIILKDVDIVMCDNMTPEQVAEVVKFRNEHSPKTLLEASGNITLENIEEFAKTGVDAISTGSPIHQAHWIDISMKIN